MAIYAQSPSIVTSLNTDLPDVADVYEVIRGEALEGAGDERRGHCLRPEHEDKSPSCGYNVAKNTFNCLVCEKSGGVLDLIVVAEQASDRKSARKWAIERKLIAAGSDWASAIRYDYTDESGTVLYQVGRWTKANGSKTFRQRARRADGTWNDRKGCLQSVERVPYLLPKLRNAVKAARALSADTCERVVFVVEGEKDADNLDRAGAIATTNAQGAQWAWPITWADYFEGYETVYVLADNDPAGKAAAARRAAIIARTVPNVRYILELPGVGEKGDVSDWLAANNGDLAQLTTLCEAIGTQAEPYRPSYDPSAVAAIVSDQTEQGAAKWFLAHHPDDVRFVIEAKAWFVYDGGVWRENTAQVHRWAMDALDGLRDAAEDVDDKEFTDFALSLRRNASRKNILDTASHLVAVSIVNFDQHPTYFNCTNGTLDLRTGQLLAHDPAHLLTLQTPIAFDPKAVCPKYEAWFRACVTNPETGLADDELHEYMWRIMGSCLEARAKMRLFVFLFGPKGTCKSTYVEVLEALLGPYQNAADFSTFTTSRWGSSPGAASPHLAALRGLRMVSAAEANDRMRLDAAKVKQLIGGDAIKARFLNQNEFRFKFEATLIMTGNEIPQITGDDSIWDKFKPVPFEHAIPEDQQDAQYFEKVLEPELPGILNFALAGLARYRNAGYHLDEPQAVAKARSAEREAQDTFKNFIEECIVIANPAEVGTWKAVENSTVRGAFALWCKRQSQPGLAPKAFAAAMRRHKFEEGSRGGQLTWKNIKLKQSESTAMPSGYNDF